MKKLFVALMLTLSFAFNSFAALSTDDINAIKTTIGTGLNDVSAISVAVFGVLAGIWGIRKVIKLMNRS